MMAQPKHYLTSPSSKVKAYYFWIFWIRYIYFFSLYKKLLLLSALPTQPTRFIRRGRAARQKRDLDSDAPSDWEEVASDIEDTDELRGWMSQQAAQNNPFVPNQILIRKFLPPGNVMSLYEEYKSTQQMLGAHYVSHLGLV